MRTKRPAPFLLAAVLGALVAGNLRAQTTLDPSTTRELTWRKTPTSLALLNHNKVVWRHVHDKRLGKPFMRIGMLDGAELTRPCPLPDGYPKADHPWHRALWWSWKWIDGVNYWEQHQQGTEPVSVTLQANKDGSAKIDLSIEYHRNDEPPVLRESRSIRVSGPDLHGYLIDWNADFTVAGKKDIVFGRNSYGGLAFRFAAEFSGDDATGIPAWKFLRSDGELTGTTHSARWMAYQGKTQNGKPATVAMFAHPDNPRYPAWWQTRDHYPYLNPSFTCKDDYILRTGETLSLRYAILVRYSPTDRAEIERAFKAFADGSR